MMKKTKKHSDAELYTWETNGKKFLVRALADKYGVNHFIGDIALCDELTNNPTDEVMNRDDEIIYYVQESELIGLSNKELANLVYKGSCNIIDEFNFNDEENIA